MAIYIYLYLQDIVCIPKKGLHKVRASINFWIYVADRYRNLPLSLVHYATLR